MLKNIRTFLVREAKYIVLLALTLTIYFMFFSERERRPEEETRRDTGLAAVRQAEQKIQERVQDEARWDAMLSQKPWIGYALTLAGILLMAAISYGLFLDVLWFIYFFRKKIPTPPFLTIPDPPFTFSDILRVIVLLLSVSMIVGIVLNLMALVWAAYLNENFMILLHTALTDLAVMYCVVYFTRSLYRTDLKYVGITFEGWRDNLWVGFKTYCGVLPLFLVLLAAMIVGSYWIGYEPPPHPLVEVLVEEDKHPLLICFSTVLACVIGPVVEEIFFRGFCYPILKKRWGFLAAALLSSAVFSAVHNSGFSFVPVFALGFVLACLFERRGSLIPCFTLHILHNTLFLSYFFILKLLFLAD